MLAPSARRTRIGCRAELLPALYRDLPANAVTAHRRRYINAATAGATSSWHADLTNLMTVVIPLAGYSVITTQQPR